MKKLYNNIKLIFGSVLLFFIFSSCQVLTTVNGFLDKVIDEYIPVKTVNLNIVFVDSPEIEYVNTPENISFPLDALFKIPELDYSSENYQFLGWKEKSVQSIPAVSELKPEFVDSAAETDVINKAEITFSSTKYTKNSTIAFIPVWLKLQDAQEGDPAHYTKIIFKSGIEGIDSYSQTILQGESTPLLPCSFKIENGIFICWIKESDKTVNFNDEDLVSFNRKTGDNTVILTALWARVTEEKEYNETLKLERNYAEGRKDRMWGYSFDKNIVADFKDIKAGDILKVYVSGKTKADGAARRFEKLILSITEWSSESGWHKRTDSVDFINKDSDPQSFLSDGYITINESPDYLGSVQICLENRDNLVQTPEWNYEVEGTADKLEIENAVLLIKLIKNGTRISEEDLLKF